jgi:hypothetical protein
MAKSRIFIASSYGAICVAEMLRNELLTDYCEADVWNDAIQACPGQAEIETLEQLTKKYDFAVIILSGADVHASNENLNSRDNCVFQAGLFMGSIGRKRCFLLSSVDRNCLPTSLDGIIFFTFTEPNNLGNRNECRMQILGPSGLIKDRVQQTQREQETQENVGTKPLSGDEILRKEQIKPRGELDLDQVVVASLQPHDLTYDAARQIWDNLDKGITYVYLFQASDFLQDKIPQLLQLVLLAGIPSAVNAMSFSSRRAFVKANKDKIMEALDDICLNDKLNIYFSSEPTDIEYCIHNATSDKSAKLYFKHGNEFIEWKSGEQAHAFWTEIRKRKRIQNSDPGSAMFHETNDFSLQQQPPFLNSLTVGMRRYFPGFGDDVLARCLGTQK